MSAIHARTSAPMESSEWDLAMTRIFDAPRELVFKLWTESGHVAQWWGPTGFTNPVCELDLRPGGEIRIHMRAPNGAVHPMKAVFQEIVEPERLVFMSSALDENGNSMFDVLSTAIFAEQHGKTLLTLQLHVIKTTASALHYLKGMEAGWTQTFDRLGDYVASKAATGATAFAKKPASPTADREIATTRLFDAPREVVWKMWTEPEHLVQWWGPNGFTTTVHLWCG
jgi:uncharacterized protein YndB with AHSA1/START domain